MVWIVGASGWVERISRAEPSSSCTMRKLLMAAILPEEVMTGREAGVTAELTGAWEPSGGVARSIPRAMAADSTSRLQPGDSSCREARLGEARFGEPRSGEGYFTQALECYSQHTTRGWREKERTD